MVKTIDFYALSWGIIGKSAPILAEITIRKSQSYRQIARQVEVHYNSITAWVRNPQVLALVHEIQKGIQDKMESQALA